MLFDYALQQIAHIRIQHRVIFDYLVRGFYLAFLAKLQLQLNQIPQRNLVVQDCAKLADQLVQSAMRFQQVPQIAARIRVFQVEFEIDVTS